MARKKSFFALAYKDSSGFFLAAGAQRTISCNHQNEGLFYINTVGEIVSLPQTTVLPLSGSATTDYNSATALVPQGNVYASPTVFGDANYLSVYRIKDLENLVTTWVDVTSYTANVVSCSISGQPSGCSPVAGFSAGTPGTTTATISWNAIPNAAGYEYVNNQSTTAPVTDGTFTQSSPVTITGLTANTTYHFWIRTICGGGTNGVSTWVQGVYTTHA